MTRGYSLGWDDPHLRCLQRTVPCITTGAYTECVLLFMSSLCVLCVSSEAGERILIDEWIAINV